jgi:ubiquinone biosynthesis monooxygenase Coq7
MSDRLPSPTPTSPTGRRLRPGDRLIAGLDDTLRTLWSSPPASRPCPRPERPDEPADEAQRRLSAALMRVNHVGEVCAQALYTAQALGTRDEALKAHLRHAAREEGDHLAWTRQRIEQLGGRTSLLNPVWYAGAFALGWGASRLGDARSLGFVIETERQVERHLDEHLERLPEGDHASRAIVAQMREDEIRHGREAAQAGGIEPPAPVRWLMHAAGRLMTRTAHHL